MILNQCVDWLKALGEVAPNAKTARLRRAVEAADRGGRWELGVDSAALLETLELRHYGGAKAAPRRLVWDLRRDRPSARSGRRTAPTALPWTPALLKDAALGAMLLDFAAHAEIAALLTEPAGDGPGRWGVRLGRPLPWPSFAALSVADPFLKSASLLAYMALDRRVTELSFCGADAKVFLCA